MITAIEIENFKGIGKRVRVELKPLTLLFGPNSAGKSTIIQALQYAYELLEHQNPDADRTSLGGDRVNLGGFRNLVHDHDVSREVRLRFDLDVSGIDLCKMFPIRPYSAGIPGAKRRADLSQIGSGSSSAWVEMAVAWDQVKQIPYVREYQVGLNGQRLASIRKLENGRVAIDDLELDHPVFCWPPECADFREQYYCIADWAHEPFGSRNESPVAMYYLSPVEITDVDQVSQAIYKGEPEHVCDVTPLSDFEPRSLRRSTLVDGGWDEPEPYYIICGFRADDHRLAVQSVRFPCRLWPDKDKRDRQFSWAIDIFGSGNTIFAGILHKQNVLPDWNEWLPIDFHDEGQTKRKSELNWMGFYCDMLTRLLVGPGQILREELRRLRYVGPLRDTPPRLYDAPHSREPSRWSGGLAAWDTLQGGSEDLLRELNTWLIGKERLDTGYRIDRRRFHPIEATGPLMCRLRSGQPIDPQDLVQQIENLPPQTKIDLIGRNGIRLAPQDVGEGIRQVLPVIVATLEPTSTDQDGIQGLVTLEQPELHLHPRQQAALGDALIAGALGETGNQIIVETHSEHLILRILRRIREASKSLSPPTPSVTPNDVGVWYVGQQDGVSTPACIPIDSEGEFTRPWPDEFFEQDFNERFA